MKVFDIREKAAATGGEYVLGVKDTGSHACYMIYGFLKPGEKDRLLSPGKGHEELVLAARGDLVVSGKWSGKLNEGHAFHMVGDEEYFLENTGTGEALYIIAGGHSEGGHHH